MSADPLATSSKACAAAAAQAIAYTDLLYALGAARQHTLGICWFRNSTVSDAPPSEHLESCPQPPPAEFDVELATRQYYYEGGRPPPALGHLRRFGRDAAEQRCLHDGGLLRRDGGVPHTGIPLRRRGSSPHEHILRLEHIGVLDRVHRRQHHHDRGCLHGTLLGRMLLRRHRAVHRGPQRHVRGPGAVQWQRLDDSRVHEVGELGLRQRRLLDVRWRRRLLRNEHDLRLGRLLHDQFG